MLTRINTVASNGDTVTAGQVNIIFLTANNIIRDGKEPWRSRGVRIFFNAYICSFRGVVALDGIGGDSHLIYTGSLSRGINVDFSCRFRFGFVRAMIVVLNIITSDLEVADLRFLEPYAPQPVVADVAGGDVDLMQVNAIQVNSHSSIKINMAVRYKHTAVALDEMNSMPAARNHDSFKY